MIDRIGFFRQPAGFNDRFEPIPLSAAALHAIPLEPVANEINLITYFNYAHITYFRYNLQMSDDFRPRERPQEAFQSSRWVEIPLFARGQQRIL